MYCFRVFTLASQYIAHAGSHREANTTKDSYTARICDGLRKRVDTELCSQLGRSLYLPNRDDNIAQKRLTQVTDLSSMIPEAQRNIPRSDSYGINEAITSAVSLTSFHDLTGISPIFVSSSVCLHLRRYWTSWPSSDLHAICHYSYIVA